MTNDIQVTLSVYKSYDDIYIFIFKRQQFLQCSKCPPTYMLKSVYESRCLEKVTPKTEKLPRTSNFASYQIYPRVSRNKTQY